MIRLIAIASLLAATTAPAMAQTSRSRVYDGPVAVVVSIPIPAGLARPTIEASFAKLAPSFEALPGLKQKYFTVNDHAAGGIYLWQDRAAADAFLDAKWREQVVQAYGAAPEVTYFDAPVIIQGRAGMTARK